MLRYNQCIFEFSITNPEIQYDRSEVVEGNFIDFTVFATFKKELLKNF